MIDVRNESEVFARQGFGNALGYGVYPALLVVDFVNAFADPTKFGGGNIGAAIHASKDLLAAFRRSKRPIVFTRIIYAEDGSDATVHCLKVPQLKTLTLSNPASHIVSDLSPEKGELVIYKRLPSAFFETGLQGLLVGRRVDTLIIVGCTTSGCVRASALDGLCHGFRPMIPADCVGDRSISAHQASLFDLGQKYADIVGANDVLAYLQTL